MPSEAEYQREYYKKNKEKLLAYRTQWARDNKERLSAKDKERMQTDEEYAIHRTKYKRNWHIETKLKSPEKYMWGRSKNSAIARGLAFDLELSDIVIPTHCPILGIEFSFSDESNSPSLDRIDNRLGYIKGNVWVISTLANRMKYTATKAELLAFANGILTCQDLL